MKSSSRYAFFILSLFISTSLLSDVYRVNNAERLDELLQPKTPKVLEIFAEWCGACKMMEKPYDEVSEIYKDVRFLKIEGDKNKAILTRYKVSAFPTIILFNKNNKEVDRHVGALSKEALREKIQKLSGKTPTKIVQPKAPAEPKKPKVERPKPTSHTVTEITDETHLKNELAKGSAVIKFTADWCSACKWIQPHYEDLAGTFKQVNFYVVRTDKPGTREVGKKYNATSLPTFVFVMNGKEVDRVIGADKVNLQMKLSALAGGTLGKRPAQPTPPPQVISPAKQPKVKPAPKPKKAKKKVKKEAKKRASRKPMKKKTAKKPTRKKAQPRRSRYQRKTMDHDHSECTECHAQ